MPGARTGRRGRPAGRPRRPRGGWECSSHPRKKRRSSTPPEMRPYSSLQKVRLFFLLTSYFFKCSKTKSNSYFCLLGKLRWDWYEQEETGSIVLYCQTQEASLKVTLGKDNQDFRIEVQENGEVCSLHFELEGTIVWPVRVIQIPNSSKVNKLHFICLEYRNMLIVMLMFFCVPHTGRNPAEKIKTKSLEKTWTSLPGFWRGKKLRFASSLFQNGSC